MVLDIIDWDIVRQQLRWVRPNASLSGAEKFFDLSVRPYFGFNKIMNISLLFSDAMNINFGKNMEKSLIDILDLGWNGIRYPSNVSEDDTKTAFEVSDFTPQYPTDFTFGGMFGLVPDDMLFSPVRAIFRYFTNDTKWEFEVLPVFNCWIFNTRSD